MITNNMVSWSGMLPSLGGFGACWPLSAKERTSTAAQSHMELVSRERAGHYADRTDSTGRILKRYEVSQMPTVEHECVLYNSKSNIYTYIPTVDTALTASV